MTKIRVLFFISLVSFSSIFSTHSFATKEAIAKLHSWSGGENLIWLHINGFFKNFPHMIDRRHLIDENGKRLDKLQRYAFVKKRGYVDRRELSEDLYHKLPYVVWTPEGDEWVVLLPDGY